MGEVAGFPVMKTVVTKAVSKDLTMLATAKASLGILEADTTHDANLTRFIHECSAGIAKAVRRELAQETLRDEYDLRDPRGTQLLYLSRRPTVALTGIDSAAVPLGISEDGVSLAPADWKLDAEAGRLWRLDGAGRRSFWPMRVPIVITHRSGWVLLPDLPSDLEAGCLAWVRLRFFAEAPGVDPRVRTESVPGVGDISYALAGAVGGMGMTEGLPDEVWGWVKDYREQALP